MSDLDNMIACVSREVAMRRRVYPNLVLNERMSPEKAKHEVEVMEDVLTYLKASKNKLEPQLNL